MSSNTAAVETPPHSNILQFPKSRSVSTQDAEEISANILAMKSNSVEEALEFVIPTYFETLMNMGFRIDDDQLNLLIVSLTRAVMYRHYGIHHPLFDFLEENAQELENIFEQEILPTNE